MNKLIFLVIVNCLYSVKAYNQKIKENKAFGVEVTIQDLDTGRVALWYYDDLNKFRSDTQNIKKGKVLFYGQVNKVCEALLWTNLDNKNFDDRSVVRFLLEPQKIKINFNDSNILVQGSKSQIEKENWDKHKYDLVQAKIMYRKDADLLYQKSKSDNKIPYQTQIDQFYKKIDSLNVLIRAKDLNYISNHYNSYLSMYLLKIHNRKISVDSLKKMFSLLSTTVKKSSIGHILLEIIYPLTNDQTFRKLNPLLGEKFDTDLNKIKSLYDFALKDEKGKNFNFSSLKGKYVVLDFWASWCGPCLANVPSQKGIIKDFEGSPIEFVSISLDTDLNRWKKALKKYDLDGIQLSAPKAFNDLISVYYKVLAPPHYIIVDKSGMIINKEAPQPINPEFKVILNTLLKL